MICPKCKKIMCFVYKTSYGKLHICRQCKIILFELRDDLKTFKTMDELNRFTAKMDEDTMLINALEG